MTMYDEKMRTDNAGTAGTTRSRRRPRGSLNQQLILDAAFALAERGGRDELHVGGLVAAVIEGGRLSMVKLPPRA